MEISIKTIGSGEIISSLFNTMSFLMNIFNILYFVLFAIVLTCFLLYKTKRFTMIKFGTLCGASISFLYFLIAPIFTVHLTDTLFKTDEKILNIPICVAGPAWVYNSLGGDLSKIAHNLLSFPTDKIQRFSEEVHKHQKSIYTDGAIRFVGYEIYRNHLLGMLDIYSDFDAKGKHASDFDTPKNRKRLQAFQHVKERIRRDPNFMFQLNKPIWKETKRRFFLPQNS